MKTILFSFIALFLITSCSKEPIAPSMSAPTTQASKVTLMKTPYGVIVPSDQYEQWKDYNPKNPKNISTNGPKLNFYGGPCTLRNGSKGLECGTCLSDCNCFNSFPCTYCANC